MVGFDTLFDLTIAKVLSVLSAGSVATLEVTIDGVNKEVLIGTWTAITSPTITFREFLNEIRDTSDWSITGFSKNDGTGVTIASPIFWDVFFMYLPILQYLLILVAFVRISWLLLNI